MCWRFFARRNQFDTVVGIDVNLNLTPNRDRNRNQSTLEKTVKFAARAQHFFRLFPPYLLGDGLIRVRRNQGQPRLVDRLTWQAGSYIFFCPHKNRSLHFKDRQGHFQRRE